MSCVPSMSAYVATHTCQQDNKCPSQANQSIEQPSQEKTSWLSRSLKYIFLGHDGVGLTSNDVPMTNEPIPDEKVENKRESMDLWSRVRHFSGSSTTSTDGDQLSGTESSHLDR